MAIYFGFAIVDSVFPAESIKIHTISNKAAIKAASSCCNLSHSATLLNN